MGTLLPGGVNSSDRVATSTQPPEPIVARPPASSQHATVAITALAILCWGAGLALALVDARGHYLWLALLPLLAATGLCWWGRVTTLRWPVAASALATALLLFGAAEQGQVQVTLHGRVLTLALDDSTLTVPDLGPFSSIRLRLDGYNTSRAAGPEAGLRRVPLVGGALEWVVSGNLLSGVTDVVVSNATVVALDPETVLWQPRSANEERMVSGTAPRGGTLAGPEGPYDRVAALAPADFALTLRLIRPSTPIRLLLAGADREIELFVYPEHSALVVYRVAPGGQLEQIAGGSLLARKSPLQSVQQLARLVARAVLTASALAVLALVLGKLLGLALPLPLPSPRQWPLAADLALVLAAAGLFIASRVASDVLERMPHVQDSVAYLFQAKTFALGRLYVPLPSVPGPFRHEFILMQHGMWFSKYPPGHPAVLALGVLAGAPWLVSPIAAGLTLLASFAFARNVYGGGTALLAELLLLSSPFFLLMSGTMMSHPTGLLFAMLCLWLLERAERLDTPLDALGAGFALGMLGASRALTALAFGAPFAAWVLYGIVRARRLRSRHLAGLLGAAVPTAAVLAYNQALTGSWLTSPFELWWSFDRVGFGPTVGMHGGHYFSWGLVNTWANLAELQRWLFAWPVALTLAFALLPFVTGSRHRWDWLLGAAVLAVIVAYIFYWADGIMYGPRYYYEIAALLAILSARGVACAGALARRLFGGSARIGAGTSVVALAGLAVLMGSAALGMPSFLAHARGYNGMSRARVDLVEQAGIHNALVLVTNADSDWQTYGSVFWANSPLLTDDVIYARDMGEPTDTELARAFPTRAVYRLQGMRLQLVREPSAPG